MRGKVKFYLTKRGFGFITAEDGNDYYFHYTNIAEEGKRLFEKGEGVEFKAVSSPKGLEAMDIRLTK